MNQRRILRKIKVARGRMIINRRKRTGVRLSKSIATIMLFIIVALFMGFYFRIEAQRKENQTLKTQTYLLHQKLERLQWANQNLVTRTNDLREKLAPLEAIKVFALDSSPGDTVMPDQGSIFRVTARSLIVREGPGKDFLPQDALPLASHVTFLQSQGVWYKVRYGAGDEGWTYKEYLTEAVSG